jgi:hypothetical protein
MFSICQWTLSKWSFIGVLLTQPSSKSHPEKPLNDTSGLKKIIKQARYFFLSSVSPF